MLLQSLNSYSLLFYWTVTKITLHYYYAKLLYNELFFINVFIFHFFRFYRFDPDRFGLNAPKRHPLAYQPFGFAGKRKCPGYRFAYYESIIFLVAIVRNFKCLLASETDDVIPVHGLVTSPKEEIYINIEKR